jgi:hypothetical protein
MAHLIRGAVDQTYGSAVAPPSREDLWARAAGALGSAEGDGDPVAVEHDTYLDEAYGA